MFLMITSAKKERTDENKRVAEKMLMKQFRHEAMDNIFSHATIKRLRVKEKFSRNGNTDRMLTFDFVYPDEFGAPVKEVEYEYSDDQTEFSDSELALLSDKNKKQKAAGVPRSGK